jgi:hypothetical protein
MRRPSTVVAGSELRAHWDASRDGTIGDRLIANVPCQSTGKRTAIIAVCSRLLMLLLPQGFKHARLTRSGFCTLPAGLPAYLHCRAVAAAAHTHGGQLHAGHGAAPHVARALAVGAGHVVICTELTCGTAAVQGGMLGFGQRCLRQPWLAAPAPRPCAV